MTLPLKTAKARSFPTQSSMLRGNGITPEQEETNGHRSTGQTIYSLCDRCAGRDLDPVSEQGQHSPSCLFVVVRRRILSCRFIPASRREPVVFDKEGFVTLGCNIHDWMIAYVAVLGTPYFRVTGGDGHVRAKERPGRDNTLLRSGNRRSKARRRTFAQHVDVAGVIPKQLALYSGSEAGLSGASARPAFDRRISLKFRFRSFQKPAPLFRSLRSLTLSAKCDLSPR